MDKRKQLYEKYREKIEKASSILVVGGGPIGIEAAGCLLMRYKDSKKIGIANSADTLLHGLPEAAGKAAQAYFEKHGVNIHLNTKYNPSHELASEYDFAWN